LPSYDAIAKYAAERGIAILGLIWPFPNPARTGKDGDSKQMEKQPRGDISVGDFFTTHARCLKQNHQFDGKKEHH
jgi:hypothetical protein